MPSDAESSEVDRVIAEFLEQSRAGKEPDREALLAAHPEFAEELRSFFANHDGMQAAASEDATLLPTPTNEPATIQPAAGEPSDEATIAPSRSVSHGDASEPKVRYFGDYELLEEIARGGMGVIYKARQVNLNRTVALKMILAGQLAGDEDVQRFYTEAEAAANLDHPGIVPIYEVGEHQGQHYFSMAFIEGESLADKLKGGPLPPREAAKYTRKISEAVAYAHGQGVIHRDLKPANVLLDRNNEPKVADFGLAKKVEGNSGLTATGQILGTPSYMPPEQAAGRHSEIGPRSDVYALGAILYELVTGRPPFRAANPVDTMLMVMESEPTPPRSHHKSVPDDLQTICLKCLEKNPQNRYGSVLELAADLQRFLDQEPITARPPTAGRKLWSFANRNPWMITGGASLVVLLLLVAVYWLWSENAFLRFVAANPDYVPEAGPMTASLQSAELLFALLFYSILFGAFAFYWHARKRKRTGEPVKQMILLAFAGLGVVNLGVSLFYLSRWIDARIWEALSLLENRPTDVYFSFLLRLVRHLTVAHGVQAIDLWRRHGRSGSSTRRCFADHSVAVREQDTAGS